MNWSRVAIIGPLALFLAFVLLVATQLGRPTQEVVRSQLIGQPLPALALPGHNGGPGLATADLTTGKPAMVNVFASWCLPCQAEAPQLEALRAAGVPLMGIAVRDAPADLSAFLAKFGNPFARIGVDAEGRTQIALGSSGVPETFIVDGKGIIRFQHIGAVTAADVPKLLAEFSRAGGSS